MKRPICIFGILFLALIFNGSKLWAASIGEAGEEKVMISRAVGEPAVLSADDILGKDTSIRTSGQLFEDYRYGKLGFEKRHLFESLFFAGAAGDGRLWNSTEFDMYGFGGNIYGGRKFGEFNKAILNYRFERYDVSHTDGASAADFRNAEGKKNLALALLLFERDTTDNALYPTKGMLLAGRTEIATKILGGDFNYSRLEGEASCLFTPFYNITFATHALLGAMNNFGSSKETPFYERYFLGSGSTVRGFEWGKAGPVSRQDNPLGTDYMLVANIESRIPVYKNLKGAIFLDTGKAFNKFSDIVRTDLRESAGLGLRYLTPWFVGRVDYGFIIDRKSDEAIGKLHLSFSTPF